MRCASGSTSWDFRGIPRISGFSRSRFAERLQRPAPREWRPNTNPRGWGSAPDETLTPGLYRRLLPMTATAMKKLSQVQRVWTEEKLRELAASRGVHTHRSSASGAMNPEWHFLRVTDKATPGTTREIRLTETCQMCGTKFTPKRNDARFCSSRCRQKAYRSRRAIA